MLVGRVSVTSKVKGEIRVVFMVAVKSIVLGTCFNEDNSSQTDDKMREVGKLKSFCAKRKNCKARRV